jgi:hypothetical protein
MENNNEIFGLDESMFMGGSGTTVPYHKFKNGEHKFRVLPPFAQGKLYHKVSIHWGYKDENNHIKALQCSKDHENRCPICEMVDKQEKIKVALEQAGRIPEMKQLDKWIGDNKRKPTYLWNVLTAEGEQKVLTLSWNGHDPLLNKIKFYFAEKKINVTDPRANYLMYVSRTGEKAKTRYSYEVLENAVKQITYNKLYDLTKVYKIYKYDELKKIVDAGAVTGKQQQQHKEEDFLAQLPPGMVAGNAAPAATNLPPAQQQAVQGMNAQQDLPVGNVPPQAIAPPAAQPQQTPPTVPLNNVQQDEVANMLNMLNNVSI